VQVEECHPYQAQIAKHYSLKCHFMQLKSFLHHLYIAECNSMDRILIQHQQLSATTAQTAEVQVE
jgi:hypothetical protein